MSYMGDDFKEWLKSENGKKCLSWPITNVQYLENRLWWAFNAGKESSQFSNRECSVEKTISKG